MSVKNIDVSQITSNNIFTNLSGIMYGNYGEMNSSLLAQSLKGATIDAQQFKMLFHQYQNVARTLQLQLHK